MLATQRRSSSRVPAGSGCPDAGSVTTEFTGRRRGPHGRTEATSRHPLVGPLWDAGRCHRRRPRDPSRCLRARRRLTQPADRSRQRRCLPVRAPASATGPERGPSRVSPPAGRRRRRPGPRHRTGARSACQRIAPDLVDGGGSDPEVRPPGAPGLDRQSGRRRCAGRGAAERGRCGVDARLAPFVDPHPGSGRSVADPGRARSGPKALSPPGRRSPRQGAVSPCAVALCAGQHESPGREHVY